MATAVHRGTPASSLSGNPNAHTPQSQVSAPVLEFRCMFTHDCHKKSKKWHDGSLRFHTFNRRVMVYDDSKNLVGDLHYRQQEEFGEGLELRLDRPVLVQVEEPLGQTNTDLTPLLGRHRQDPNNQSTHPTQPTRATLSRTNAANSQLKPKSIKELLGASQGRLGRARLPTQSPFEQRQPLSAIQTPTEPSPKRRKIGPGKENESIIIPVQPASATIVPAASRSVPPKPARPAAPVVDISSDEELDTGRILSPSDDHPTASGRNPGPNKPKSFPPSKPKEPKKKTKDLENNRSSHSEKGSKKQKQRKSQTDYGLERNPTEPMSRRKKNAPTGSNTDEGLTTPDLAPRQLPPSRISSAPSLQSQRRFASGPRSSLKFLSQKPRPKLMYKALLTPLPTEQRRASRTPAADPRVQDRQSTEAVQLEAPSEKRRRTDLLDLESFFAASQIARETAASITLPEDSFLPITKQAESSTTNPENNGLEPSPQQSQVEDDDFGFSTGDVDDDKPPSSPLFMPRTTSQISPLPSQRLAMCDQNVLGLSQEMSRHESPSSLPPARRSTPRSPQAPDAAEPPSSPAFVTAIPKTKHRTSNDTSTNTRPAPLAHRQPEPSGPNEASPCALPHPLSKVKSRLFRRVVSEQLPQHVSIADDFSDDEDLDETLEQLKDASAKAKDGDLPPPLQRLQRATSDPIVLENPLTINPPSSPPAEAEQEPSGQQPALQPINAAEPQPPAFAPATDTGPWTTTEAFLLFDWWPPPKRKPDYGQGTQTGRGGIGTIEDSASVAIKAGASKKYGSFGSARLVSQR